MGYATVCNIPRIHNYKDAFNKWQSTKPIRGREPEIRPLGERRDCDTYSIRKNVWTETIECVLYRTPVVKFTPDDEILINFGAWASASTCQFITRLVVGVGAHQARGNVVLHFNKGVKAIVEQGEELVLVQDTDGNWMPKVKQTLYDYRINRKEANNVRKQVSQFRDYLSGVVKLKAEPVTAGGIYGRESYSAVSATYDDLIAVFGVRNKTEGGITGQVRPDVGKWVNLNDKPRHCRPDTKAEHWAEYRERAQRFFDLVRNDQDDNVRHQNYFIAFNILLVQDNHLYWRDSGDTRIAMNTMQFEKTLDKFMLTMFSDRAFKKIALPDGKVPSNRYDNYVLTEKD